MRMRIVLVPSWVEQALVAAKKPLPTLLDVMALSGTLSKEDVAIYMDLHERLLEKMFRPVWESFDTVTLYPYFQKDATYSQDNLKLMQDYLSRKLSEIRMETPNGADPYKLLNQFPLFGADGQVEGGSENRFIFEAFHLLDDVIGIRTLLKKDDEDLITQDVRAYDGLMKIANIYIPMEELARTPAFNQYIRLLGTKL